MANRKRNVSYVSQEEPAFLKQFKQRVGYKEAPGVDAKFAGTPDFDSDDDQPEGEDEKPQVVVLKKGDLTADEAARVTGNNIDGDGKNREKDVEDGGAEEGGRIVFRKPVKRSSEDKSELQASTKKPKDSESSDKSKNSSSEKKRMKDKSKKSNKTLLSFDDEEEEED